MNRWHALVLLLVASAALLLRVPNLGSRPMHNDEGVNAVKFGDLLDRGQYRYDPHEYHGPTLHYATLVVARLAGVRDYQNLTETTLRLVPLLFGLGLIFLLPLFYDGLGPRAAGWAGLFIAVSPSFVFYSQYFIHEMLLVFFTAAALGTGWRYWRTRKVLWVVLCGASLGLMHATKETFVFCLAAGGGALVLNRLWNRCLDTTKPIKPRKAPNVFHLILAVLIWLGVAVLFFSSFFHNAQGPLDSLRTYLPWLSRAGGASPHIQPWYFYFQRLLWFKVANGPLWSELAVVLLAAIGLVAGVSRRGLESAASASFIRFLALYTVLLSALYTVIPYKTPWCFLGFWHGAILLAGVGAAVLVRVARNQFARVAVVGVLLMISAQLAWQAWSASTTFAADRRNPFVYAQTSTDIFRMLDKIRAITDASPAGRQTRIYVVAKEGDYWPLPWYLRSYTQVGYFDILPPGPPAPINIVSASLEAELDQDRKHLMTGYYELRPGVFNELYVGLELWTQYLAKNPPPPANPE